MRILLIDGSNLHEAAKSINLSIDYSKLLTLMKEGQDKFRAYYFTALPNRSVQSKLHKLTDWLGYNGYTVISKETKEYQQDSGEIRVKGNMDVEITVHALRLCSIADEIFLFSGDGDFTSLVAEIQMKSSTKVCCVSSRSFVSGDLRKQCDEFFALESMAESIRQEMKYDLS